jgi:hypothetical protein
MSSFCAFFGHPERIFLHSLTVMKPSDDASFEESLRRARLAQAARLDALTGIRDAELLRLQVLRDDLAAVVARSSPLQGLTDLALIADDPPTLWIDLVTHVVMAPDRRTYCLVEDRAGGSESLFSSRDRAEMAKLIAERLAHRMVERERMLQPSNNRQLIVGHSSAALLLAWLSGLCLGAVLLLILLELIANSA